MNWCLIKVISATLLREAYAATRSGGLHCTLKLGGAVKFLFSNKFNQQQDAEKRIDSDPYSFRAVIQKMFFDKPLVSKEASNFGPTGANG
jgi:hypothetical protein